MLINHYENLKGLVVLIDPNINKKTNLDRIAFLEKVNHVKTIRTEANRFFLTYYITSQEEYDNLIKFHEIITKSRSKIYLYSEVKRQIKMQVNTKPYFKTSSISQVAEISVEYSTEIKSDILSKEDVFNSIDEFINLENNWDGYGAIPLSLESAKNAKEFISGFSDKLFKNFYDGYPNTHATISFEWKNKNDDEFFTEIGDKLVSYYLILKGHKPIKKDLIELSPEKIKTIKSYIKKLDASI